MDLETFLILFIAVIVLAVSGTILLGFPGVLYLLVIFGMAAFLAWILG